MPPKGRGRGQHTRKLEISSAPVQFKTVGVRRPDIGKAGRPLAVHVNAFIISVPEYTVYQYDVVIEPAVPAAKNFALVEAMQEAYKDVFKTPRQPASISKKVNLAGATVKDADRPVFRCVFDGRKNLFSRQRLPLGDTDSGEFLVPDPGQEGNSKRPRIFTIRLTKVQDIDLSVLRRYTEGKQAQDGKILTGIMALNVIVRMAPIMEKYPFNTRSFFTPTGARAIGGGLELWRGYFQSVRPVLGRMLVNIDISTGLMYKPGSLIGLSLEFLGWPSNRVRDLSPERLGNHRIRLQHFIAGLRVTISPSNRTRTVQRITKKSARTFEFTLRNGGMKTVEQYFQQLNITLAYPEIVCVEVGKEACIPMELCTIPPGQLTRKQVPPERMKDVLSFSTSRPEERLKSITAGLQTLAYEKSVYMSDFELDVQSANGKPLPVQARVIKPPTLQYGADSKQPTVLPHNGAWNMIDKRVYQPVAIGNWAIIIYESMKYFSDAAVKSMVQGIVDGCDSLGIRVVDKDPLVFRENGQGDIEGHFRRAGTEVKKSKGEYPNFLVFVLPEGGNEIYRKIKHYGDVKIGVATQCLKAKNCSYAKKPFWANVLLKVNAKLGGINLVDAGSSLADPHNPTVIMGADMMDAPPGTTDKPAFASLVSSIDPKCSRYVPYMSVQPAHQQIIEGFYDMCKRALYDFKDYTIKALKKNKPMLNRIIFYRDGVSEGEYQQVLERELPFLKKACEELELNPKITLIIVGKRHHIRFFPQKQSDGDRSSGNCPAGTVVDTDICHPTDFDYYLLSHGGLKGTSRPAHYVVLHDENQFSADSLQALSFSLCHVYARATRSVSIPSPVYYADIVCTRAPNHFDPKSEFARDQSGSGSSTQGTSEEIFQAYKGAFMNTNEIQRRRMYYM